MSKIAELLKSKGFDLNTLKEEAAPVAEDNVVDMPLYIFVTPIPVKEPKYFNNHENRWLCPDWTTNRTICPSNKQSRECKPNCSKCVLRKEVNI
jgi:hypothetical protein